jgi:mannose/fructose/sorbose-specific phosphotransferase system IIA component
MIGIVLAAHGPLPAAFLESTNMILGELPQVASVSLMPGDSLEGLIDSLQAAVNEVNTGDGVLILLDMFGGTPANAAALLTQQTNSLCAVTGVNLPMLLETSMARMNTDRLESLAATAFSGGQAGIVDVVKAFKKFRQGKTDQEPMSEVEG